MGGIFEGNQECGGKTPDEQKEVKMKHNEAKKTQSTTVQPEQQTTGAEDGRRWLFNSICLNAIEKKNGQNERKTPAKRKTPRTEKKKNEKSRMQQRVSREGLRADAIQKSSRRIRGARRRK